MRIGAKAIARSKVRHRAASTTDRDEITFRTVRQVRWVANLPEEIRVVPDLEKTIPEHMAEGYRQSSTRVDRPVVHDRERISPH